MLAPAWTPTLASAALLVGKSTLLLCAAAAAAHALRRGSAAARHMVWCLALGGAMALPAAALVVPGWKPAFLAVLRPAASTWGVVPAAGGLPALSLLTVLAAIWAGGAAVVLARLALGLRAAARLARHAERVDDPAWTGLLERLGRAMEVRRPVSLLRSDEAAMPLTWGAFSPAILLPAEADAWPEERRRVVLLHELAHVARRDCLVQSLAMVCCAAYWFHPGAWWAARRMREEREQACDDRVLAAGARASDYAGHLLDVARAYRAPACAAAIAMAAPSQLEGRVRAVLEPRRDRRAVTRRTGAICAGAVLLATLPLAAVSPSERAPAPPREFAWELPPARSVPATAQPQAEPQRELAARPGIRVAATVKRAPRRTVATQTVQSTQTVRTTQTARAAQAAPRRRDTPALLASVDADGGVHVNLKALRAARTGRPLRVRVEGHGTTSAASVDIRVDPRLQAMVTQMAAAARSSTAPCTHPGPTRIAKKFDAIVRSAAASAGGGSDLAVRVLDELNAGLSRAARADELSDSETGGA